ncbi:hypothetical protein VTH06DRAFT_5504 [Thermothelomyces fergusii]
MAAEAPITAESLRAALTERLQATHVEVQDMSGGCGQAFSSLIVSAAFAGKTALGRHRLVNAALRDELARIHAWSARCQTPDEHAREKTAAAAAAAAAGTAGTEEGRVVGESG